MGQPPPPGPQVPEIVIENHDSSPRKGADDRAEAYASQNFQNVRLPARRERRLSLRRRPSSICSYF